MRAFLKKGFWGLCLAMIILAGFPTISRADGCLDVRDYGYHRYNNRCYDTLLSRTKKQDNETYLYVKDSDGNDMIETITKYKVTEVYQRTWCCVCGKEKDPKETFTVTYYTEEVHLTYV